MSLHRVSSAELPVTFDRRISPANFPNTFERRVDIETKLEIPYAASTDVSIQNFRKIRPEVYEKMAFY